MAPEIGKSAPAFTLPDQDNKKIKLADFKGKWVVLYFYPEDDTPDAPPKPVILPAVSKPSKNSTPLYWVYRPTRSRVTANSPINSN